MELIQQLLTVLGLLVCLRFTLKCLGFSKYLFPRLWGAVPPTFFQSMGEWAVVTGAGDGIGKAYSIELANRGMNIVMISRTPEKMQSVALEIEQATGRKVKIIQADFTNNTIYASIEERLKELEIGVLVNNVGMLPSPHPCPFLAGPDNDENLINCNTTSAVKMTRIILKQMKQRRKGLILNISSAFGSFPCPLYALYSASKAQTIAYITYLLSQAFITTFSKAIQAEYKPYGIIVQAVTPYGVSTPMIHNPSTNIITKSSGDFVRESLNHVTQGNETYGCMAHAVLGGIMNQIPLWVIHNPRVQGYFQDVLDSQYKNK